MIDIRQSKQYANYLESEGWTVERIANINYFIKKVPIIGSIIKVQRPQEIRYKDIKILSKKYQAFQVIIEPDLIPVSSGFTRIHTLIINRGFRLSRNPYLPTKTLQLDLTKPLKFKKETRRCIKIGEKNAIIKRYSTPNEIKTWRSAWRKSAKFNRFVPSIISLYNLAKSFPQNDSLFLASHNISGSIIGGALFTKPRESEIMYYWYAFTNSEGRTSLSQYSLLNNAILWGKKHGVRIFDFEGIYDPRFPNKSWLGFTHFKKSFGGMEVFYPGTFTKFRLPF